MGSGSELLALAETRLGEKYVNVCVPKNNPDWHGPWDCAEYMSWLVYQVGGFLYGCIDDQGNPATVEAYTGAWQDDSRRRGIRVAAGQAAATVGAILLRFPPSPGSMGHIVVCDGQGGTVEAAGRAFGVRRGRVSGRAWDTGVLLPGFAYGAVNPAVQISPPEFLFAIGRTDMAKNRVRIIQRALRGNGISPGPIDGTYGHVTAAAVAAYQATKGLIVDGQVGMQTARRLKVDLAD